MRRLILLAALALAGCDRGIDLSNATIEEVAAAAKDADKQKAGMWDVATEVEALDLGAMGTAQTAAQLKQQLGRKQSRTACLTQAEASVVGVPATGGTGAQCRFDRFRMKAGTLDGTMRCSRPEGQLIVTQKGTYAPENYDMRTTIRQVTGGTGTSMTIHVTGKRTGDCKIAKFRDGEAK